MSLDHADPCVHKHIDLLQTTISRMAANSSSCKTWCVTLISGIVVVSIDKNQPMAIMAAMLPVVAFFLLDSYYLSLEKEVRYLYEHFITRLHGKTLTVNDLFQFKFNVKWYSKPLKLASAAISFSVWPFYSVVSSMLIIVYIVISKISLNTICFWK